MIINVTGCSGCGKSFLSQQLAKHLNLTLINVDSIVEKMYGNSLMQQKLKDAFGSKVTNNNIVEKKLVSNLVLNNKQQWDLLNELTWPYIESAIDDAIKQSNNNAVIDYKFVPLTKYFNLANYNILVTPKSFDKRFDYLIKRDNITLHQIKLRDSFCPNYSQFKFDYTIQNCYTSNFEKTCNNVVNKILEEQKW